jgi:hypothetical protein
MTAQRSELYATGILYHLSQCGHRYNVHKMIYDEGEEFSMFCPVCTARYPRKDGKIDAANFEIKK